MAKLLRRIGARPETFKNFINGEWVESAGGETYENRNPADHDHVHEHVHEHVNELDDEDVHEDAHVNVDGNALAPES